MSRDDDEFTHESGVSNGDVDWLFRGKSKKLVKKMEKSKEQDPKEEPDNKNDKQSDVVQPDLTKSDVPDTPTPQAPSSDKIDKQQPGPRRELPVPTPPIKIQTNRASTSTTSTSPKSTPVTKSAGVNQQSKSPTSARAPKTPPQVSPSSSPATSKLDMFKFGRSRSSSNPNVPVGTDVAKASPVQQTKRRSSLNYIAETSSLTVDLSNEQIELIRQQSAANALANAASSSNTSSPSVSRSNSGKRSLFSSLSSKFKSEQVRPQVPVSPVAKSGSGKAQVPTAAPPKYAYPEVIPSNEQSQDLVSLGKLPLHEGVSETNKFFKKRVSSSSNSIPSTRMILNKNPNRNSQPRVEGLDFPMRRVTFAIDKLTVDPQQQIPSRRPRKGDVLIPDDLTAPIPRLAQGICLSDGTSKATENKVSEKELLIAIENQKRALLEAEKHAQEAHSSGRRIAHEVSQYRSLKMLSIPSVFLTEEEQKAEDEEDESPMDQKVSSSDFSIDKPLHMHENHFDDSLEEVNIEDISLETIYTRCCHLREILPIPATLKQLKGKKKPLQVLKLLNSKPTLIDVLSFSDFIAITPLNTAIFDNVTMNTEMLKHFLSSLANNKSLEKLSLRNVAIDECGWKHLCKLLSVNRTIKKLDISQQRVKPDTKPGSIRSSMNWKIFIQSLVIRGGLEELVINGCKLSDETFKDLVVRAVKLNTYRLGIASTELNMYKAQVVADWLDDPNCKCVGVDVAFNDLSQGQLRPFIKVFNKGTSKLIFFSLNSTHLNNVDEANQLIKSLAKIDTLRFLDLSSIPDLFPGIISTLSEYLPLFPTLKRIHFDLNDLSGQSTRAIAGILPKVNGLYHVSLLGNKEMSNSTAGALYSAIKLSKTIYALDLDYDLVPDELSSRIVFYLIKNMDQVMEKSVSHIEENDEELMFDGSLLMQAAEKLLAENDKKYDKEEEIKIQSFITKALIERARKVRQDIHRTIDILFARRNEGTLSLDGKETLLRFCLLDSALENLVNMFEQQTVNFKDGKKVDSEKDTFRFSLEIPSEDQHLHESSTGLITSGPILSPHNTEKFGEGGTSPTTAKSTAMEQTTASMDGLAVIGGYFPNIERMENIPHSVVIDSTSDGSVVPIDNSTGRPVLMRSISQTSIQAKELEQEEGELHRWGLYVQSRKDTEDVKQQAQVDDQLAHKLQEQAVKKSTSAKEIPLLQQLPSGPELRDAIIAAKGIESVTDLINRINKDRVSGDKIEKLEDLDKTDNFDKSVLVNANKDRAESSDQSSASAVEECPTTSSEEKSIDSGNDGAKEFTVVVDEVYEKLLNDAQRARGTIAKHAQKI